MLQGILAVCCFPQLSYISASVRELIKIDFIAMLPPELSFKILSYLDTYSLCKAAQVNRAWKQMADDDVVWHKMCEQHIEKRCKKCGWGLPLPEKKRLMMEKESIRLRAAAMKLETSSHRSTPAVCSLPASREGSLAPTERNDDNRKRSMEETHYARTAKRHCFPQALEMTRRPWKEVYKRRFKVGTNWKYGRHNLKILKGHTDSVMCLQFQDNLLVTGSYDGTIKLWDIESGEEKKTLRGHLSGVRCLQLDQNKLLSGSFDKTIKVWNLETGQCLKTLSGPSDTILSVHLEGSWLGCGSMDNSIRVWNSALGAQFAVRGHSDFVNSVRVDAASRTLFSASDDRTVRLWDLTNQRCLRVFTGHVGPVQQVLPLPQGFEPDDIEMEGCGHDTDTDIELDDTESSAREEVNGTNSTGPSGPAAQTEPRTLSAWSGVPFFPEDMDRPSPPTYILTAGLDNTIRLWHVPSGRRLRTFFGHLEGIWALSADNLRVVSGAQDRMVKIWDPRTGICERTFTGHAGAVTCVGLSSERIITGSEDHEIRIMEFGE